MVTAAISGHRPEKIRDWGWVRDALKESFALFDVDKVVVGMAAGVDLIAAKVAHENGIPFVCAKPWAGHTARVGWKMTYASAIRNAIEVVDVDPAQDYPGPWVYQKRNKWMVDHSDFLISVWDGSEGGTANCVYYAYKMGVRVYNLNPNKRICDFLVPSD